VNIMKKRWILYPSLDELRDQISQHFEISRVTAQILINRGLNTVEKADRFLNITLKDIYDPFLMYGMDKAINRLLQAFEKREPVLIHGDYDVDGVTSTAILYSILSQVGIPVYYYIPNRLMEGYGLGEEGIQCALRVGAKLMITVDCGINAINEVEKLKQNNIDVIITDHHMPGDILPDAVAIVNPNQLQCNYPFKDLAGVGVCFKFLHALLKKSRELKITAFDNIDLKDQLDMVALGTIADMMPLIDENRIFVQYGLKKLSTSKKVGIRKLKEKSGIQFDQNFKTYHVSFFIAPRINSIGRLKDAALGVQLMISTDEEESERLAEIIEINNRHRQQLEETVFKQAKDYIENNPDIKNRKIIIAAKEDWPVGIVSIVASRLTREYNKPAIVLAIEDGIGRGSARSINSINLLEWLKRCQNMLLEFGGHSYAAGLSIREDQLGNFIEKINAIADQEINKDDLLPEISIDFKLSLSDIGDELMKEIEMLSPYGQKNSRPIFLTQGLTVQGFPRYFGRNHVKFVVEDEFGIMQEVIGFNMQSQVKDLTKGDKVDIVYSLNMENYSGIPAIQLQLVDVRAYK